MTSIFRSHTCGELNKNEVGKKVKLSGWVHSRRDHGGVLFVDLRDRYGITQVVFYPECPDFDVSEQLRREDVITIDGSVKEREKDLINPKIVTGEIEVHVESLRILNKSETPPFEIEDNATINEDLRLEFRYLDMRRKIMQDNLIIRHKAAMSIREFFNSEGFLELETPMLVKPTPEGARDYIVPSRVNKGNYYALPQSPQIYKQLLMVSGFDKYFQIARCLRDEDLRADRQPEFTQIDVEMSFVDEEQIYDIGERMIKQLFKKALDVEVEIPFRRLTHGEAMSKYGSDKPDLRFDLELSDVTDIAKESDFSVFKQAIDRGGIVKCINPDRDFGRNEIDEIIKRCQEFGAKGMAWARVTEEGMESNIMKYFSEDVRKKMIERTGAKSGSMLMFIADKPDRCNFVISRLRNELAIRMGLIDKSRFNFVWITDFPLFEWDEQLNDYAPAHHMFTMPKEECLEYLEKDKSKVFAKCYDLVLNGVELGSGSIRIHDRETQQRVMNAMGIDKSEAETKFGFLLKAFKYGAPPHGGFALGFDRLVSLMRGYNDIREVIAFPKNKHAQSPTDGCPIPFDEKSLEELNLELCTKKE